ncbi:forkhead box protein P3 isoform X2 [Brachyhypopomus gauderio]
MPQLKRESDWARRGRDGEGSPGLKEEPDDEFNQLKEPASLQPEEHLSSQNAVEAAPVHFQLPFHMAQLSQNRPSVLRSTSLLPLGHVSVAQPSPDKREPAAVGRGKDTSSSRVLAFTSQHKTPCTQPTSLLQSEVLRSLFINGRCCWPSCDQACEEDTVFLEHLSHGHGCGERTIAQCKVQQERVQHMEDQLIKERQKLHAMRLHLRASEHPPAQLRAGRSWPKALAPSAPPIEEPDGGPGWASVVAGHQKYWPSPSPHLPSDFVSSMECYKYVNIRPPYTYAFLIRWSILEAPDKQRALNEIYNWFIQMFYYFRHNTPTWKNAVRHNLSLHKCFVRVDGRKGAVWTVDEREFQKRKGQKFNRDSTLKWLACFSHPSQVP